MEGEERREEGKEGREEEGGEEEGGGRGRAWTKMRLTRQPPPCICSVDHHTSMSPYVLWAVGCVAQGKWCA